MKTLSINVYTIDELSEESQQVAFKNYKPFTENIGEEIRATIEGFEKIFPCERGNGNVRIFVVDKVLALSGVRLSTYIYNTFAKYLYKSKYYNVQSNEKINHKRVVSKLCSNGNYFNAYHSAITKTIDCPLTGCCYDYDMLKPIVECLEGKFKGDFEDLMKECYLEIEHAYQRELNYCYSFEYFKEESLSNGYLYTLDGNEFYGAI